MTNENTTDVTELRKRASELQKELKELSSRLNQAENERYKSNGSSGVLPPPGKESYLFKWQDRTIGWGGTKWALRFVKLNRGRISYYYSHLETSPRYTLSLRGCAIADEGWKRNRRHLSKTKPEGKDPPIDEVGAYFFVFSIYHRPDSATYSGTNHSSPSSRTEGASSHTGDFVPLLRFSTPSLAEKTQWIELLSEACAYCETDAFLEEEATRNAEEEFRRQQQQQLAQTMPQAERGTLPPLYFATGSDNKRSLHAKRPSFSKLPKSDMFRTMSKSRDAEKSELQGFPPSKAMHRTAAPSVLSAEAPTQNYRGLFNLGIIILIVSNFRLVLSSVQTHGFVLGEFSSGASIPLDTWEQFPFLSGLLFTQVFLVIAFLTEWLLGKHDLYEPVGMILHQLNAHISLAINIFIVWNFIEKPAVGGVLLLVGAITWMKLISYALANQDYRQIKKKDKDSFKATLAIIDNLDSNDWNIAYPMNVTFGNIYYFWLAPTLTYQIAFPKTPRVRPLRVVGILIRMLMTLSLFTFLIAQIVAPTLNNLLMDLEASGGRYTYSILADYWLKLTITNTYLWLLVFYFYFHLYLNLFAELLRFGDRVFYKDWWNSTEVSAYWRLWNLPVHYWLVRHIYFPCVRRNLSKTTATFLVFFFSAVMHEVLISIPFHMLRPWSFLGMMGQLPLVMVTKFLYRKFPGSSVGNVLFWLSFCVVGQPMAILLYTIDYNYGKMHNDDMKFLDSPEACTFRFRDSCLIR